MPKVQNKALDMREDVLDHREKFYWEISDCNSQLNVVLEGNALKCSQILRSTSVLSQLQTQMQCGKNQHYLCVQ